MEAYYTTKQIQDIFKVDRITVYRMLQDGRIKGIKIGMQWRFPQSEVERLLGGENTPLEIEGDAGFPIHCIQTIQDLFASVSRISAMMIDPQGDPITEISQPCGFCRLILSSASGKEACQASWRAFTHQYGASSEKFSCHAGLQYIGSEVRHEGELQAYFLAGEMYWAQPDSVEQNKRLERLSTKHNLPLVQLRNSAAQITVLTDDQREHLAQQPPAATRALESILNERWVFFKTFTTNRRFNPKSLRSLSMKKIVVLGAGTAGTMVANRLARMMDMDQWQITIVDEDPIHYYQAGYLFIPFDIYTKKDVVKKKKDYIAPSVKLIQSTIESIEPEINQVRLSDSTILGYDYLIIATGADIHPEETPGLAEHEWGKSIHTFYTLQGAVDLTEKIRAFEGGRIVVNVVENPIKCPVAPMEFLMLADWHFQKRGIRDKR